MRTIRFYQQQRSDGGVRSGLGIDDEPVLHEFIAGDEESDPALLWYVDVVAKSSHLPGDAEHAREWFVRHRQEIQQTLRDMAERLTIGLDEGNCWPYSAKLTGLPRGVAGEVRVSAVRSLREGELARHLRLLADAWEAVLSRLAPLAAA